MVAEWLHERWLGAKLNQFLFSPFPILDLGFSVLCLYNLVFPFLMIPHGVFCRRALWAALGAARRRAPPGSTTRPWRTRCGASRRTRRASCCRSVRVSFETKRRTNPLMFLAFCVNTLTSKERFNEKAAPLRERGGLFETFVFMWFALCVNGAQSWSLVCVVVVLVEAYLPQPLTRHFTRLLEPSRFHKSDKRTKGNNLILLNSISICSPAGVRADRPSGGAGPQDLRPADQHGRLPPEAEEHGEDAPVCE